MIYLHVIYLEMGLFSDLFLYPEYDSDLSENIITSYFGQTLVT